VKQTLRDDLNNAKKARFKEIYQPGDINRLNTGIVRKMRRYAAAAAAILAILFAWYLIVKPASAQQLAAQYIKEHFQSLDVAMSGKLDEMQTGLSLYNDGKFGEALQQFEKLIARDSISFEAKKNAGIVSLKLKDYDKALDYFTQIENDTRFSNPAKLYKAITLMERNGVSDKDQAKELLQQIVQNNLEGKETARQWIKKW
jgi:tetratricopeptide (TPR) repeat protein